MEGQIRKISCWIAQSRLRQRQGRKRRSDGIASFGEHALTSILGIVILQASKTSPKELSVVVKTCDTRSRSSFFRAFGVYEASVLIQHDAFEFADFSGNNVDPGTHFPAVLRRRPAV